MRFFQLIFNDFTILNQDRWLSQKEFVPNLV
ncbi:Uncharacterised protein [Mycobacteroides abscessus subsp. abscessus]|nr:Uncharacterised protein [Mycobacteroides abscessus subsp. abscessus]